jgi:cell division protein FtsZ
VVATGIDTVAARPGGDTRIAELTQKLRADTQRLAERLERTEPPARNGQPPQQPAPVMRQSPAAIEQAATAAVAAAVLPPNTIGDVTIRSLPPKPSLFMEPSQADPTYTAMPPAAELPPNFIPPQPERPASRPRMPRMEELPLPAQRELRAKHGQQAEHEHPEKRRMTLLQRLASVGLGRREEEEPEPIETRPMQTAAERQPARQPPRESVSDYARRAPQGLDPHGRQAPVHNSGDDDQLDIPAFLRRQAN